MTEGVQSPKLPEPNPLTMQAHRRQAFWQIKFPLLVALFLVLFGAFGVVLAAVSGSGNVSLWADISLIYLIAPMLLLTLIMIAATAAMVYLIHRMLYFLPRYSHLLLGYFVILARRVEGISNAMVEPFLRAHSVSASVRALQRAVRGKSG